MKQRIVIAGGRKCLDFRTEEDFANELIVVLEEKFGIIDTDFEIIEGGALGADRFGRNFAICNGIPYLTYLAEWDNLNVSSCRVKMNRKGEPYNALAGYNRNNDMSQVGTGLVALWDGESSGTRDMINRMYALNKQVEIIKY